MTPPFFCVIITCPSAFAYVYRLPPLSDEEVRFRNLYKAGQRRVADAKRKRKERLAIYNERKFKQLELDLIRVPNQKDWLLDRLS